MSVNFITYGSPYKTNSLLHCGCLLLNLKFMGNWVGKKMVYFPEENFRGETENLKMCPVFPVGMFQREIRVPFLQSRL